MTTARLFAVTGVLVSGLCAVGCKKNDTAQTGSGGLPPIAAPGAPGAPAAPGAPGAPGAAPAAASIKGKVLEKIEASPYSYLRLETAGGELWAAVPTSQAAVGAEVTVRSPMPMDGFESKTLKRKFDHIVFGTLAGEGESKEAPAAAGQIAAAHGMPGGPAAGAPAAAAGPGGHPVAAAAEVGDVKVPKAEGPEAKTVSEVWKQKDSLKDKTVLVRGKVVKYNAGVMGKNWVHVRDGSGTDAAADNDLTATTSDTAAVGDVIVVKGTVHLDKDFGAGYKYSVIVEDAKLQK